MVLVPLCLNTDVWEEFYKSATETGSQTMRSDRERDKHFWATEYEKDD